MESLKEELTKSVSRGVKIHIVFGHENPSDHTHEIKLRGQKALELIAEINKTTKGSGKIIYKKIPNHAKILLCDSKYVICGSNNWLSNTAFHNSEVSLKITDLKIIKEFQVAASKRFEQSLN